MIEEEELEDIRAYDAAIASNDEVIPFDLAIAEIEESRDKAGMQFMLYPCPCCGYLVFDRPPGTYEFCPVCAWQDDVSQLRFVKASGRANRENLIDAQKNYLVHGVSQIGRLSRCRQPSAEMKHDENWRPIDFARDNIEISDGKDQGNTYPRDRTVLYYWRETYWRQFDPMEKPSRL